MLGSFDTDPYFDSDEESSKPSQKKMKKADYSKPVFFVSSGSQIVDQSNAQNAHDPAKESLQRKTANVQITKKPSLPSFTKSSSQYNPNLSESTLAEKFGLGAKMLKKMGFVPGQGLGKDGTGISEPLQAKLRAKNAGLGYYGSEQTQSEKKISRELEKKRILQNMERGIFVEEDEKALKEMLDEDEVVEIEEDSGPKTDWKKSQTAKSKPKTKYEVVDIDDQIGAGMDKESEMEIYDYTSSAEPKIIRKSGSVAARREGSLKELCYNVSILLETAKAERESSERVLKTEQKKLVKLQSDIKALQDSRIQCEYDAMRMKKFIEALKSVTAKKDASIMWVIKEFIEIKDKFYEYFTYFEKVQVVIATLVIPLITSVLENWDYLQNPLEADDIFVSLQQLLLSNRGKLSDDIISIVAEDEERLYYKIVDMTLISWAERQLKGWNPLTSTAGSVLMLIVSRMLFSETKTEEFFNRAIFPRLFSSIRDPSPTDCLWIKPWLKHKSAKEFVPQILQKLGQLFAGWNPSDAAGLELLNQWKDVIEEKAFQRFLLLNVLPKLSLALSSLQVNPADQHSEPIEWALRWNGLIKTELLVKLFISDLFPKWHRVLMLWLTSTPNFMEIQQWYTQWKSIFPSDVLSHPSMKRQFSFALDAIAAAHRGDPLPDLPSDITELTDGGAAQLETALRRGVLRDGGVRGAINRIGGVHAERRNDGDDAGRDELIRILDRLGAPHQLAVLPTGRRNADGVEIMKFGKASIVIDLGQILVRGIDGKYTQVPLETLLEKAVGTRQQHISGVD